MAMETQSTRALAEGLSPAMAQGLQDWIGGTVLLRSGTRRALAQRGLISPSDLTTLGYQVWAYLVVRRDGTPMDMATAQVLAQTADRASLYVLAARVRLYPYAGHGKSARARDLADAIEASAVAS